MFLHLSFLIELLESTSSSYAYRTEKLSQFLELLQKVKLYVAQHFLGQQAKLCVLLARKQKADIFQGLSQLHLRQELREVSHF